MSQRDLFGSTPYPHGLPGYQGPSTSRQAAEKVSADLGDRQVRVLRAIRRLGPSTTDELCIYFDLSPNQISGRLTELKKMGYIKDTGEIRKTRTGFNAKVLGITGLGVVALNEEEKG